MVIKLIWQEGRNERWTETEIPEDKTWEEIQEYVLQVTRKAYRFSTEPLPKGVVNELDL